MTCEIFQCANNVLNCDPTTEFFPFPKIKIISDQWVEACGQTNKLTDVSKAQICSLHFEEGAFIMELKNTDFVKTLREDAVPTLFLMKNGNNDVPQRVQKCLYVHFLPANKTSEGQTSTSVKIEEEQSLYNLKKYSRIKTHQDLLRIKSENAELVKNIESLKTQVETHKTYLQESTAKLKSLSDQLALERSCTRLTTLNEQEKLMSKVFSRNQIKVLYGKKRVQWSNDDMAVGFTIRHLSNKRCYLYLTKTLNIPLPGMSSIKKWVATNKNKAKNDGDVA